MNVFYIGGSPCSGKSTTAMALAKKYGLYYFEVDKSLEKHMKRGALDGAPACSKVKDMNPEQIWMRDPQLQCEEEFAIYAEIFAYAMEEIKQLTCKTDIITEGAAFCPVLMRKFGIPPEKYIAVVPSPAFQISHYKQREWVKYFLEGCSDKEKAFDNWMQRDILFAERVKKECKENEYQVIVNNGNVGIDELENRIGTHFGFHK